MDSDPYFVMPWTVLFHPEFWPEFLDLRTPVQDELAARMKRLQATGPLTGRPDVDTLKGSSFATMEELRFSVDGGVWRVAFAFDPDKQAVLLVAGDKAGVAQDRFYRTLIRKADERYARHLHAGRTKG